MNGESYRLATSKKAQRRSAHGQSATSLLNSMHLPAIALDRCGFVVDVNAAAAAVFDDDVKVKDKRLFVRDLEARAVLKASLDSSASPVEFSL